MFTFTTFSLWLHVTAFVVWVGGRFALAFVLLPVIWSGLESPKEAARLVAMSVERFQRISREVIFVILLTGLFNLINAGIARGFNFSTTYLTLLAVKVSLFLVVVVIQFWQSLRLVPALVAVASDTESGSGAPQALKRLRKQFLTTSLLSVLLAGVLIFLGLALRYR